MQRNPTNNFKFKNYLFGAINIVKRNGEKEKYVCSGYGITFDSAGLRSFSNYFAINFLKYGADNSSLSHSDNLKNKFLILGEGPTYGINESFGSPEEMFSISCTKSKYKIVFEITFIY